MVPPESESLQFQRKTRTKEKVIKPQALLNGSTKQKRKGKESQNKTCPVFQSIRILASLRNQEKIS
jgi:hypothetical protein